MLDHIVTVDPGVVSGLSSSERVREPLRVRVRAPARARTWRTQIHSRHRPLSDLFSAQLVLNELIMTH